MSRTIFTGFYPQVTVLKINTGDLTGKSGFDFLLLLLILDKKDGEDEMAIITLPRSAIKEISDKYVKLEIPEEKFPIHKINLGVLKKARGLLKDTKIDPLKYQRKSRSEWDRHE
ncbi:hypothetical protein B1H10_05655 [candidate division KSB1 bacterium 4484_188]|nr:MAG: hypothetical protein B1H10_05655 [candidate division KSB1 bacterium 4484_188]